MIRRSTQRPGYRRPKCLNPITLSGKTSVKRHHTDRQTDRQTDRHCRTNYSINAISVVVSDAVARRQDATLRRLCLRDVGKRQQRITGVQRRDLRTGSTRSTTTKRTTVRLRRGNVAWRSVDDCWLRRVAITVWQERRGLYFSTCLSGIKTRGQSNLTKKHLTGGPFLG